MTPGERLEELASGANPALVLRMASGFAVMGESQFLPGYCLLLAYPQIDHLTDLDIGARTKFLLDMSRLGDAVMASTGCKRINYSIYGNLDPFLHAHVFPRYEWEDPAYRHAPPFSIPGALRQAPSAQYSPVRHADLLAKIRRELELRVK